MASKRIDVPDVGPVTFVKSVRSRSIRLSVTQKGVRVSLPRWTPYAVAVQFAVQHAKWITNQQLRNSKPPLIEDAKIGKLHTLHFERVATSSDLRTKVTATKLVVPYYAAESPQDSAVQARAEQAAIKALRKEAAVLLHPRLDELALQHGHTYNGLTLRQLTRRWGSCDSKQHIVLNIFLMQLSWQQIDYVMCHELAHTKHMDHSAAFWQEVERMMPDAKMIAKRVRYTQPALQPSKTATALDDDMAY